MAFLIRVKFVSVFAMNAVTQVAGITAFVISEASGLLAFSVLSEFKVLTCVTDAAVGVVFGSTVAIDAVISTRASASAACWVALVADFSASAAVCTSWVTLFTVAISAVVLVMVAFRRVRINLWETSVIEEVGDFT